MAITRATVSLHNVNEIEGDAAVNVWHFLHAAALDQTHATKLAVALHTFYNQWAPYMSACVSRPLGDTGWVISMSNLTMGSAGPDDDVVTPMLFNDSYVLAQPTASFDMYPNEVACCLSFRGDVDGVPEESGTTRPRARRRGRVYLGPFQSNAGVNASDGGSRPSSTFRDIVMDAYVAMLSTLSSAAPVINHVIYSPTTAIAHVVKEAWIDDAWDTVRSRGLDPVSRDQRTVSQGAT